MPSLTKNSEEAANSLQEFKEFFSLPVELRIKVWTFALYTPQVIAIARVPPPRESSQYHFKYRFLNHLSPLLLVNRESRYEALKSKNPILLPYRINGLRSFVFRVNLNTDIIWIQVADYEPLTEIMGSLYLGSRHTPWLEEALNALEEIYGRRRVESGQEKPVTSGTIAVSWHGWAVWFYILKEDGFSDLGSILHISTLKSIREVMFVVGNTAAPNRRDITFVPVKQSPKPTRK